MTEKSGIQRNILHFDNNLSKMHASKKVSHYNHNYFWCHVGLLLYIVWYLIILRMLAFSDSVYCSCFSCFSLNLAILTSDQRKSNDSMKLSAGPFITEIWRLKDNNLTVIFPVGECEWRVEWVSNLNVPWG